MNVTQATRVVTGMVRARVPVPLMLVGPMGIGKSWLAREVARLLGRQILCVRLSNVAEVGDLSGMPLIVDGCTTYAPPTWWPDEPGGILFLDEINRASRDLLQAIFELVDSRRLFARPLPDDWTVIAAMNPPVGDYLVEPLGPAFLRRFCQLKVEASPRGWQRWAEQHGVSEEIRGFLSQHPGFLFREERFELEVVQTPEGWRMVDEILRSGAIPVELEQEVVAGLVGTKVAAAFFQARGERARPFVSGEQILHDWSAVRERFVRAQTDQIYRSVSSLEEVVASVAGQLPSSELAHLLAFLEDAEVPDEWRNVVLLAIRKNPALRDQLQRLPRFQQVVASLRGKALPSRRRFRRHA